MDLALNNLLRLICHKTKTTNISTKSKSSVGLDMLQGSNRWTHAVVKWYPRDRKRQLERPPQMMGWWKYQVIWANQEKGEINNEMEVRCDQWCGKHHKPGQKDKGKSLNIQPQHFSFKKRISSLTLKFFNSQHTSKWTGVYHASAVICIPVSIYGNIHYEICLYWVTKTKKIMQEKQG